MPGVLDSDIGLIGREVGKMAFNMELNIDDIDLQLDFDASKFDQFLDEIDNNPGRIPQDLKQRYDSSTDSDNDLGPDGEKSVDLMEFCERDLFLPNKMIVEADNNSYTGFNNAHSSMSSGAHCSMNMNNVHYTSPKDIKKEVSGKNDPFMGLSTESSSFTETILGQIMSPLEDHSGSLKTEVFSGWNQTLVTDEFHSFTKALAAEDLPDVDAFPESPSSLDDRDVNGDDSDVDIETVTDAVTPRSLSVYTTDSCSSLDCSPLSTPSASPTPMMQQKNLMNILSSSNLSPKILSQSSTTSLLHGISSQASLEENLMVGRSCHSRKHEGKHHHSQYSCQSPQSSSSGFVAYSMSHSSVYDHHFHDYALSPSADLSPMETAKPTVMSKKLGKKRSYVQSFGENVSEKEKQHHHNQLERNRRQKLADLFTDLRDVIPKINTINKASKVVILNEATEYITDVKRTDARQEAEISSLVQKQLSLERHLRNLKSQSYI